MSEFFLIMPEIFLAMTLAFVVVGEVTYYGEQVRLITATAFLGLGAAFIETIISYKNGATQIFGGVLSIDGFSLFFKLLFIILAGLTIGSVSHTKEIPADRRTEYCALVLAAALAMCLIASASDLILIFLSLLFLNVVTYFLAAYGKRSITSTEAAVKYLIFGAVASALLLYSLAILFASTHTLNIYEIHRALLANPISSPVLLTAFMLSFLALCAQIGAFPMYLLVPDIMEGAPTPISAFLSLGSRAAGFAIAIRFLIVVFAQPGLTKGQWQILGQVDWPQIVSVISALTMAIGSLLAIRQKGAKRLVGYLAVAETGFLLMGLLVLDELGIAAILYNLVIDLFALIGSFYVLSFIYDELQTDRLEALQGMLKKAVPECICLVMFLLCLAGSPPMPGFIGKFTLIGIALRHHRPALAMVGVFAMVISTVAVARLAYQMMGNFQESAKKPLEGSYSRKAFLMVLVIPMALIGIFADLVFRWVGQSLGFIFW